MGETKIDKNMEVMNMAENMPKKNFRRELKNSLVKFVEILSKELAILIIAQNAYGQNT